VLNLNKLIRQLIREMINEDFGNQHLQGLPHPSLIRRPPLTKPINQHQSDLKPISSRTPNSLSNQQDILKIFSSELNKWWNSENIKKDRQNLNTVGAIWTKFKEDNKDFANQQNISLLNQKTADVRKIISNLIPYGQLNEKNRKHFVRRRRT
jgi:hypothetical protein